MKFEKVVSSRSANMRRARDIAENVEKKTSESCFLDPAFIDPYEKPMQRPVFGGRLDVSWVRDQL